MAIVPFRRRGGSDIAKLRNDMDDMFSRMLGDFNWPFTTAGTATAWPALDIADRENDILVRAEVPGLNAEDVEISVHGNVLSISGEKKESEEDKKEGYYHSERSYGSFRRDITLPTEVDPDKVNAEMKNGVLTVTLPKAEKAKTIKVKVKGQ